MKSSNNQTGVIPLPLLVATIGIVIIFLLASVSPFRNNLLSTLFPKQKSQAATTLPWLKTQGNKIVTESGQQVILRGVNIMRSEWNGLDMTFERTAFPHIANNWKGNVVVRGFASNPINNNNAAYLAVLDEEQALAEANNIYIVFVFRGADINGDQPEQPDTAAQNALVKLAQRYHGKSNVMYGLAVEPSNVSWATLRPKYETMVDAIRAASTPYKPIIMASGTQWGRYVNGAITNPVNRENIVYKSHPYDPQQFFQEEFIDTHDAGLAVFVGEFGTGTQMSQTDVNALLSITRQKGISWAAWIFDSEGPPVLLTDRTTMNPNSPYGVSVRNEMLTTPPIPLDSASPLPSSTPQPSTGGPINDSWVFYGDSITSVTMDPGPNDFAHRVMNQIPNSTITQVNEGYGGNYMRPSTINDINSLISQYPNSKFITVNLGTNNSNGASNTQCYDDPDVFYNDFVAVVTRIRDAGKIPVVPTIPWRDASNIIQCTINLNNKIKNLYTNLPFVVAGPDLYKIFENRPDLMPFHPTATGSEVYKQSWANWAIQNVYSGNPLPSPSPLTSPSSSASATPIPSTITVNFNNFTSGNQPLNGQYPVNILDWGSGIWLASAPWGQFTTPSTSFTSASINSGSFLVLPQKVLTNIDAFNGGTTSTIITISCSGNPDKVSNLPANQMITINTNWTQSCGQVNIISTNGWETNFDNLVLNSPQTQSPSPLPTPTQKPGDIDGNNKVDIFDYNILLTNFGQTGANNPADLDKNGKVDIFDFNILLTNFGK